MNTISDVLHAGRIAETPIFRRRLNCLTIAARCLLPLLLFTTSFCRAAVPVVTNVRASQSWLTQQVEIRYDLQDADSATVRVSLLVSEDGGGTWNVPAQSLSGFGFGDSVAPGNDRYVLWNAPADWPGRRSNLVRFRVVVDDDPNQVSLALIPAGSFQMGNSTNPAEGATDELPVHTVYVSAFYMDRQEVTKALWDDVRAWGLANGYTDLPAGSGKAVTHPVQTISWYSMVKWCNARSQKEGLMPMYYADDDQTLVYKNGSVDVTNAQVKWDKNGYRLPTEAEWERAARGGSAGQRFPWGATISHSQANYVSSSLWSYDVSSTRGYHPVYAIAPTPYTSPVGSFAPNAYGLYDMEGNVGEQCWDWYSNSWYSQILATENDTQGPDSGVYRIGRGSSWYDWNSGYGAYESRAAYRTQGSPGFEYFNYGFRCVRREEIVFPE